MRRSSWWLLGSIAVVIAALALYAPGGASLPRSAPVAADGPARMGDVNCSGAVDTIDSLQVLRLIAGLNTNADCMEAAGDTDCDGDEDSVDSLRILRHTAGLTMSAPEGCTPVGEPLGPPQTSEQLIDEALKAGEIDEGEATLYRAYWAFHDPRLPQKYQSSTPGTGDVPDEIFVRPDGMSAEVEAQLDTYLIPPSAPGSWYANLHGNASGLRPRAAGASTSPIPSVTPPVPVGNWKSVLAPSGRLHVWWDTAGAMLGDEQTAQEMAAIVDGIWAQYEALLGVEPLSDGSLPGSVNGGDALYDVYLAPLKPDLYGYVSAFTKILTGTQPCPARPTFMVLNNVLSIETLRVVIAHELFHSFQRSFSSFDKCGEYGFFQEASAAWAQDFIYPGSNLEHSFTGFAKDHVFSWPHWDQYGYSGFNFLMYLARTQGNGIIGDIFQRIGAEPLAQAIDDAHPDGLAAAWKEFVLFAWNQPPFDQFKQWDGVTFTPITRDMTGYGKIQLPTYLFLGLDESEHEYIPGPSDLTAAVEPVAVQYFRFSTLITGAVKDAAYIRINNPLFGAVPAHQALQLLYRAEGETLWKYEDITNKSGKNFCQDVPEERAAEFILIVSNADTSGNLTPDFQGKPLAVARDSCGWVGTVNHTSNIDFDRTVGPKHSVRRETVSAHGVDLVFSSSETDGGNQVFLLESGTLAWDVQGSSSITRPGPGQNFSCTYAGTGTLDLEEGAARLDIIGSGDSRTYTLSLTGEPPTFTVPASCTGSHGLTEQVEIEWLNSGPAQPFDGGPQIQDSYDAADDAQGQTQYWEWRLTSDPDPAQKLERH